MSHPIQNDLLTNSLRHETKARPLPVAFGRDGASAEARERMPAPPPSETRLQGAVGWSSADPDLYADMPCTD